MSVGTITMTVKRRVMPMEKKKIMVVDDDEMILQVVQIILESEQYDVLTSVTGTSIFTLDGELPDLIILDVLLSGEDGREICRQLKSRSETCNIPVILFSAQAETRPTAIEAGADYFLPKPFDIDLLTQTVATHLKHHTGPAA